MSRHNLCLALAKVCLNGNDARDVRRMVEQHGGANAPKAFKEMMSSLTSIRHKLHDPNQKKEKGSKDGKDRKKDRKGGKDKKNKRNDKGKGKERKNNKRGEFAFYCSHHKGNDTHNTVSCHLLLKLNKLKLDKSNGQQQQQQQQQATTPNQQNQVQTQQNKAT